MHGVLRLVLSASVGVILVCANARAADIVWTNTAGGLWDAAENWHPNQLPTLADDVFIALNGDYVVTVRSHSGARSLTLGGTYGRQSLLLDGSTFTLGASAQVGSNAVLTLARGCLAGNKQVTVDGVMNWTGGTNAVKITISTNGLFDISGDDTKYYNNATVKNYGTANWRDDGCQIYLGTVVFDNYGIYNAVATTSADCPVVAKIKLTNYGTVNAVTTDAMLHEWAQAVTWSNHGVLNFVELTSFDKQPASRQVVSGSDLTLSVEVKGVSPFTYQWFRDGAAVTGATNRELKLNGVLPGQAGLYFATVSNVIHLVTSSNALLVVDVPPLIVQQPMSWTANEGDPSSVRVLATGHQLTYQWRQGDRAIVGATNASLSFPSVTGSDAGKYRVDIFSGVATVRSAEAELTVILRPGIQEPPQTKYVNAGSDVTLSVKVAGTAPFSYQWLKGNEALAGANQASLVLRGLAPDQEGFYAVIVANAAGWALSDAAEVAIKKAPTILTQPESQTIPVGSNAVLRVVAYGKPPPSYQWERNGVKIAGANAPTLIITNAQPRDGGHYQVVVENSVAAVESVRAELTILVPDLPFANDFLAGGIIYTTNGVGRGTNCGATKQPGEPTHAGKGSATNSVWLSWWAPANGIATFNTLGSGFDTVLAVYRGTAVNSLTKMAADDDDAGFHCSEVSFNAQAGTYYEIAVAGVGGSCGDIILSWDLLITTELLPQITQAPQDITGNTNDTVTLQVLFDAFEPTAIQWFHQGQTLPGATNVTFVIANLQDDRVGGYAVRLTGASGRNVVSPPGDLQINTEGATEVSARNKFFDAAERALTP